VSAFIDEHRARFGLEPICRVLGVSASAYYQRKTGQRSQRRVTDERLLTVIRETHTKNYEAYGYRRMWLALKRAGHDVGRDHVKRLMRAHGIQGAKRRGKPWRTTTPDSKALRPPDLVDRDVTASRPDELWVADFTYPRCWEGLVFFSFVIDVFSRRVVGWQFASDMRTRPGPRCAAHGTDPTPGRRRRAADPPLRCRQPTDTPAWPSPRSSTITACWPRSDRSAMPMTTRWPRASSIASRPS
jgi:helix-turn-helix protein